MAEQANVTPGAPLLKDAAYHNGERVVARLDADATERASSEFRGHMCAAVLGGFCCPGLLPLWCLCCWPFGMQQRVRPPSSTLTISLAPDLLPVAQLLESLRYFLVANIRTPAAPGQVRGNQIDPHVRRPRSASRLLTSSPARPPCTTKWMSTATPSAAVSTPRASLRAPSLCLRSETSPSRRRAASVVRHSHFTLRFLCADIFPIHHLSASYIDPSQQPVAADDHPGGSQRLPISHDPH